METVTLVGVVCRKCQNHVVALACSGCGEEYSYGVGNPLKKDNMVFCCTCGGELDKAKSRNDLATQIKTLKLKT